MQHPASSGGGWSSWHLHLGSAEPALHDRVLTDVIGPTLGLLGPEPWFFIRYWQGGPHLRLRVRDLSPASSDRVEQSLRERLEVAGRLSDDEEPVDPDAYRGSARRLAATGDTGADRMVSDLLPPGVHRAVYEPEVDRYGGLDLMPRSEQLFQLSSEIVLALLPRLPDQRRRALLALRGTMSAAAALGGGTEQSRFYGFGVSAWRAMAAQYGYSTQQLDQWCQVTRRPDAQRADPAQHGPFGTWHAALTGLAVSISRTRPELPGRIVSSHVHMLHNRLGLSMLEELRSYAWLAHEFPVRMAAAASKGDKTDR